ncbi:hypothetical protein [Treponema sp. Marseille-Q3903]|uniref:hypothetical protein n=1 Tax=Treponema sp. Marseille-Q3903 TaxID=2766703 RepID=UPI0016523EDC|nr:hypothetical protein [Treponema sp. Marseille-Q3903]MBC6714323.1 hypothetical protein [Treponema sp. Marseille-Q3903]
MKKILGILSFFLVLGVIFCISIGFVKGIPISVPTKSAFVYKLFTGLEYFLIYIPVITITGFVVSCAVYFGRNPEGSTSRFSKAMVERYKSVMISSIVIVFVLSISTEVLGVFIGQKKQNIINRPKLINEYIKVGNNLFDNGYYERAMLYGDAALKLDPNSVEASSLKDKADVELTRAKNSNIRIKLYESVEEAEKVDRVRIEPGQLKEVYEYYQKSKEAFDKKQWFNAHYFAELGIKLASPKDPNFEELKKLSTAAWNNLTEYHNLEKTRDQKLFDMKYKGYLALVEKNDLKAYYIFRELYQSSREFQSDPDVVFYLKIAENRINERFFFIDETLELESFENANDVHFVCNYKDGSRDIIYFKGMTAVEGTGDSIQYLRSLTIESINRNGELFRTMNVPYAKVLPVSVNTLTPNTKQLMGIDEKIKKVPYLMFKSVERDKPGKTIEPQYIYANGETSSNPDYMLLSISYDDLLMLEHNSGNPQNMQLLTLINAAFKADSHGFCGQIYSHIMMNRLFYPFWILILFVLLASLAWNNRIEQNQYVKFSWAFGFVPVLAISSVFYKMSLFVFKILNYVLLCGFGIARGMIAGTVFYTLVLIFASILFLARCSRK